jgi:hypothetical protein
MLTPGKDHRQGRSSPEAPKTTPPRSGASHSQAPHRTARCQGRDSKGRKPPPRPAISRRARLHAGSRRLYTHPGHRPPHSRAHKAAPRVRTAAQCDARSKAKGMGSYQGWVTSALTQPPAPHCQRRPEPVKETRLDRTRPTTRQAAAPPASRRARRPPQRSALSALPGQAPAPAAPPLNRQAITGTGGLPAGTGQGWRGSAIAAGDATKERP